jgi:hypothetical protein
MLTLPDWRLVVLTLGKPIFLSVSVVQCSVFSSEKSFSLLVWLRFASACLAALGSRHIIAPKRDYLSRFLAVFSGLWGHPFAIRPPAP